MVKIKLKINPVFKDKRSLTFIAFFVWILFFDSNNLLDRYIAMDFLHKLENDKIYYQEQVAKNRARYIELNSDKEQLEKFAREQYFMKYHNEDIFIIEDE